MSKYLRESVSNGIAREQALIRRWWHEEHKAQGRIVWEYHLEGRFADAIWFPNASAVADEQPGKQSESRFPLANQEIVLCEAKAELTPELIGQALVYARFASRAGAIIKETVVFTESGSKSMQEVARELGLMVVVQRLDARR
jgi:hypothetical protein